jgi:hypothetical protein
MVQTDTEREREKDRRREREKQRKREREKVRERERMCTCTFVVEALKRVMVEVNIAAVDIIRHVNVCAVVLTQPSFVAWYVQ